GIGEQPVAPADLLPGPGHEGVDLRRIGIDDEGKPHGIDGIAVHEGRRFSRSAPDRDRLTGGVQRRQLVPDDALGALRRVAVERRLGRRGDLLERAADAGKAEDDLAVIAVPDRLDMRGAAPQHAGERPAGELRAVLEIEIDGAARLDHSIDAWDLEIDEAAGAGARGREGQALEEAERIAEMLHDVPGDDEVGANFGKMAARLEQLGAQRDRSGAGRGAVRIEADVAAVRPLGGEGSDEAAVAMPD